jgi:hypothetical protein
MSDWQPKPKVYTLYGFAEGRAIGKVLRRELRQAEYINTRFKSRADVLIAHSGGCLLIPKKNKAKLIVLVDPPFWPGKNVVKSILQKIKRDYSHHREVKNVKRLSAKTGHNGRYLLTTAPRTARMRKAHRQQRFPEPMKGQKIILIRNLHDPFCSPTIAQELPQAQHYEFQEFAGEHDDIWHYPKKYIELIDSVIK